jgi:hypothetical protein
MASTYSALKIELIATGEQSGTWGTTTNTNLGDTALGEAITGSADVAFSSSDVTVTLTDTNASQAARNLRLNLTGTSGGARQLILGSGCQIEKLYLVNNGLADAVTVKNTSGTGIAVPAGKTMFVYNNGTNVVDATTYLSSLTLGSALPIASGGTGSTSTTYVNLASNVTGTLPVGNGGTGITSLGAGVATWLGTPSSANLATAVTDETGSGALVFATAPTFTTSIDGGSTFAAFASPTTLTLGAAASTFTQGSTATGASSTTNIATAALSGAFTKAINIGTGGTTSSTTTINMGSATNGSTIIRGSLAVGSVTANTTDGAIWASNNVTAYASSDIRFKENVRDIPNALEKVEIIGGKLFDWTAQYIESMGGEHSYFMHKSDAGVIAQDVEKAIPELVRTREDGSLAVDYPKLVALAFAAIKELSEKVKILEGK